MNKREKKLLILTAGVVALGGATWLLQDDETPPAPEAEAAVVETVEETGARAGIVPSTFVVSADELDALLEWRAQRSAKAEFEDPFVETVVVVAQPETPEQPSAIEIPTVTAIYKGASSDQGAIMDGEVRFKGEMHRGFKVTEVTATGVHLEQDGRRYFAPYVPSSPNASASSNSGEKTP